MLLGAALNPQMDENLQTQIEAYAEAGFQYIDLALDYPAVPGKMDAPSIRDALERTGLPLHGQTPAHLPFGSPYADVRNAAVKTANEALAWLEDLGAQTVVFHPDGDYGFVSKYMMEWNAESLQKVDAATKKAPLLLENLPHGPFTHVDKMVELIQTAGLEDRVRLNVDVGHVICGANHGGSTLDAFLQTGRVRHVHVSDNDGQSDLHLPLGQGTIDWSDVKRQLAAAHVPEVTIECYSGGMQGMLASKALWEKA